MCRFDKYPVCAFLLALFPLLFSCLPCSANNTLSRSQSMRDGQSLISVNETFELGFFSPENSTLRYLGIWYHEIHPQTVFWVANRDKPIFDKSGVLKIAENGNLVLLDGSNQTVWSPRARIESNNTVAVLRETGSFALSDESSVGERDAAYWESFDEPTDTFVPEMRVRVNPAIPESRTFRSWNSKNDPSPGRYTMGVDADGAPQIVLWEEQKRIWRSGQWDSQIFTGVPDMYRSSSYLYGFKFTSPPERDGSVYIIYVPTENSGLSRFRISYEGKEEMFRWDGEKEVWNLIQSQPAGECERYNYCGNFGVCNGNVAGWRKCSCIDGYEPRTPHEWSRGDWTGGCRRRVELNCKRTQSKGEDGFQKVDSIKLPDFESLVTLQGSATCRQMCLNNCSCNAYAQVSGIGCLIWTADLIDIQSFENGGNALYVKLPDAELGSQKKVSNLVIVIPVVLGAFLLGISIWLLWRLRRKVIEGKRRNHVMGSELSRSWENSREISGLVECVADGKDMQMAELPIFSFCDVAAATNNFSEDNKLGQGGFGPVYKGKLPEGQEIAVKRLSVKSIQGLEEFKNEIIMIAKLQHRNLVRLLGCCIQGEEKMLLYEYMPNKSLDGFLFDESRQALLNWKMRFEIVKGIARGLLYLHRDSRLRIIHRDLKASNILLDKDMTPKISDFGMARIFRGNQHEANTVKVVGTYGYMAPEYAMEGLFSVKSDVYSFGVLLLEIVSSRRNVSFRASEHGSLIGYAWHLWKQGNAIAVVEPWLREECVESEALRCIHVGMLCVQDSHLHRPNMASVVTMLESEAPLLPMPRHPSFTSFSTSLHAQDFTSVNDLTISIVSGR